MIRLLRPLLSLLPLLTLPSSARANGPSAPGEAGQPIVHFDATTDSTVQRLSEMRRIELQGDHQAEAPLSLDGVHFESSSAERRTGSVDLIRTMSLNVRIPEDDGQRGWNARRPRMKKLVEHYDSHIVGAQELVNSTYDDLDEALDEIKSFWWVYVDRGDGEGVGIYVDRTRFIIEDSWYRSVPNSERNNECPWWASEDPKNRPIVAVRLRDKQTNQRWYVYNTHYPSRNSCERVGMSRIFSNFIGSRWDKSAPVIVLGDLNDGITATGHYNSSFSTLLLSAGLHSAYTAINQVGSGYRYTTTTAGWQQDFRRGTLYDHVLVENWWDVAYASIDYSLFTASGELVPCRAISSTGKCNNTAHRARDLYLYSDHWASIAEIYP